MIGDWVDRINDFWSVLLLGVCAIGSVLVRHSMTSQCWCPPQFTASHVAYAQTTHLLSETYYRQHWIVPTPGAYSEQITSYHLWIPIILFLLALAFKIPQTLSSLLEPFVSPCIINKDTLLSISSLSTTKNDGSKTSARLVAEFLSNNNILQTCLYIGKKVLMCANLVVQIIFLQVIFKSGRHVMPEGVGNETISSNLPREPVLHDFSVRRLQQVMAYTVQCVSPVNEVYDKLFIFLWYWILFVAIVSVINTALWSGFFLIRVFLRNRVTIYLTSVNQDVSDSDVQMFVKNFLGWDGALLLQFLSLKGFHLQAAELTKELWVVFKEKSARAAAHAVSSKVAEAGESKEIHLDSSAESPLMPACPENTPVNAQEKPFPVDVTSAEIYVSGGVKE